MSNKYIYLFPYETIPQGSRILIYGAGDLGQHYLKQMLITNYTTVIGFIDKNYEKYDNFVVPVHSPDNVDKLDFDFIVLAFKRADYVDEIIDRLVNKGIQKEQIIYIGLRNVNIQTGQKKENTCNTNLAYEKSPVSVALKYGPGLGDAIVKKALVAEIINMLPEALIDIYAPGGSNFIPTLYSDMRKFNCVVDDGGGQYLDNMGKYTISMSIFRLIEVDHINFSDLENHNPLFAEAMRKHIDNHKKYKLSNFPATQIWIHYGRAKFNNWNCYSLYKYTGVFSVERNSIKIPLDNSKRNVSDIFGLSPYITINYGNGAGGRGYKENNDKQWPLEYFNEFVMLFKETYADIKVAQIGDSTTEKIDSVDNYFLGRDLEEIKWILKGALLHIDIEGGLVHLATNLGTKCVVLFGPTQPNIYAYPNNINIVYATCNGCYGLYENGYACARGLEKPECMYSITPEMVMEKIAEYIDSNN